MKTDIHTRFITLIGTPLSQSSAAAMQNAAYEAMGEDLVYFYTETGSEHLKEIIEGVRHMPSFLGCAVTKPNKAEVMQYLDEFDPLCAQIGSSNTVVKTSEGKLRGYNTDAAGFIEAITKDAGFAPLRVSSAGAAPAAAIAASKDAGTSAFLFGAGGVGRAIGFSLASLGTPQIFITDRFEDSARALASQINSYYPQKAVFVPFGEYENAKKSSLIVNASGVGMGKTAGQTVMPASCFADRIHPDTIAFDACYNPARTQFLLDAEAAGCRVLNGLSMSLYQGIAQIRLWTGKEPPIEVMRNTLSW